LYLLSDNENYLLHVSSGKLENPRGFMLEARRLDTFVLCIGLEGTAYFRQGSTRYSLGKNQYLILFAGYEHVCYKKSEGPVSYYWCHFSIKDNKYRIIDKNELLSVYGAKEQNNFEVYYILPEYGELSDKGRAMLIFKQLLDMARSNTYSTKLTNYCLSLLALEISQEYLERDFYRSAKRDINPGMEKLIEWIRINYNLKGLNLKSIASSFKYSPNYLCETFHKYMGMPLMRYITQVKIDNAKKLLLYTRDSVKEIAWKIGYEDEKTFMKRFKQLEDITPTTYRNAFSRTKIVKN
jgi:AraC-like DNA-binding protein